MLLKFQLWCILLRLKNSFLLTFSREKSVINCCRLYLAVAAYDWYFRTRNLLEIFWLGIRLSLTGQSLDAVDFPTY